MGDDQLCIVRARRPSFAVQYIAKFGVELKHARDYGPISIGRLAFSNLGNETATAYSSHRELGLSRVAPALEPFSRKGEGINHVVSTCNTSQDHINLLSGRIDRRRGTMDGASDFSDRPLFNYSLCTSAGFSKDNQFALWKGLPLT